MINNQKVAVLGAGIAGVSAAVYLKRAGLDFTLFEPKAVGGQLLFIDQVDNYVGLPLRTKGRELAKNLSDTLAQLNIKVAGEEIEAIKVTKDNKIEIDYSSGKASFDGLICASGAAFKTLGIKGESEFLGRGVSYCAICDGYFFKGKEVAVVGGGNTAVEEALYLSNIAKKVYLVHRRDGLRAMDYLQQEVRVQKNIELVFDHVVEEITGDNLVGALTVKNIKDNRVRQIKLNGVFVAIGVKPATDLLKGVINLDENGFILTDEEMKTSCDFIWACGDCRKRPLRQLITAAAEGAIASISACRHLKGSYISA